MEARTQKPSRWSCRTKLQNHLGWTRGFDTIQSMFYIKPNHPFFSLKKHLCTYWVLSNPEYSTCMSQSLNQLSVWRCWKQKRTLAHFSTSAFVPIKRKQAFSGWDQHWGKGTYYAWCIAKRQMHWIINSSVCSVFCGSYTVNLNKISENWMHDKAVQVWPNHTEQKKAARNNTSHR